ncbi:MAG TPA: type I-U CRISPR-associated RAMP protein Csb1/Cas7u [Caulobacteraceae bacterium]|nr:type I-U CRISPR-associated RAMP protein Csb1/Cas7u [Caulobacteraceae bacterium]
MDYAALRQSVGQDAAIRRRQRLQPVGGKGDKIFPPTYPGEGRNAGPRHVFERRRVDGEDVWCVLIDSVQSQANRLEEALLAAAEGGELPLPRLAVDFASAGFNDLGAISSLDAPHRVFDAILRDSLLGREPFMKSEVGQRLQTAKMADASAVFELSPTALLFGAWNSTGEGGGLGAKFPRCLVSEVIAVNTPVDVPHETDRGGLQVVTAGRRTGSRIDPLGVLRKVEVWKGETGWDVTPQGAGKGAKKVRPSEINHGNIAPSVQALGVTCDYAEQVAVITFAGLRRLRFGADARNEAARAVLAALGLAALLEQDAQGYALRSRCDLVCEAGSAPLELIRSDGTSQRLEMSRTAARQLYRDAMAAASAAGFTLQPEPLMLTPQEKLVAIVRESRRLALEGSGGEEVEASAASD